MRLLLPPPQGEVDRAWARSGGGDRATEYAEKPHHPISVVFAPDLPGGDNQRCGAHHAGRKWTRRKSSPRTRGPMDRAIACSRGHGHPLTRVRRLHRPISSGGEQASVRVARRDVAGDSGAFLEIAADGEIGGRRAAAVALLVPAI